MFKKLQQLQGDAKDVMYFRLFGDLSFKEILPSYVDGLTSEYTNQVIEEHIKSCESCNQMLQRTQEPEKHMNSTGKEVDYMKKVKHKMNKWKSLALGIAGILILVLVAGILIYNRVVPKNYDDIFKRAQPDIFVVNHPVSGSELVMTNDEIRTAERFFEVLKGADYYYVGRQESVMEGSLYHIQTMTMTGDLLENYIISDEYVVYHNEKAYELRNNKEVVDFLQTMFMGEPEFVVYGKNEWSSIDGVYVLQGVGDELYGSIEFDYETRTFSLAYDALSSHMYFGDILFTFGDRFKLIADEPDTEFVFIKKDENTIVFDQDSSNVILALDGSQYIKDGSVFMKIE